jgi:hypothetical protein
MSFLSTKKTTTKAKNEVKGRLFLDVVCLREALIHVGNMQMCVYRLIVSVPRKYCPSIHLQSLNERPSSSCFPAKMSRC